MTQRGASKLATLPRRAKALELMLEGRSDREIGQELGVEASTIWRWRTSPDFAAELQSAQRERLLALNSRMAALVPRAIETIADIMDDPLQPGMLRLRAAESLLERASWSTGARERRFQELLGAELDCLTATLADRLPAETFAAVVTALETPWQAAKAPTQKRPHIVVAYPGADDETQTDTPHQQEELPK